VVDDNMSITTKTGDSGYTSLLNGERVHKSDIRIELLGTIDELTSYLGVIKSEIEDISIKDELEAVQNNLYILMAQAASGTSDNYKVNTDDVSNIEKLITKYENMYISQNKFIIPGKTKLSAFIDVGRTIARRAERKLIYSDRDFKAAGLTKKYVNRISDYLYALARYIDFKEEIAMKVVENLKKGGVIVSKINNSASLNLKTAKLLLERIEEKAQEIGLPVVISIANQWGNVIAVHFMDGALPGSYNIAVDKAYTSAVLRMSTEELGRLSQDGQPLYGINNTNDNRIIIFGGGVPLKIEDTIVGGLGISGGSAEQDTELAVYGANIFKEVL
jgi:ATP:cob(I)alamin adenosyltransferase